MQNTQNMQDTIINLISKSAKLPKIEIKEGIEKNYFDAGWMDSFSFITFISDLEEKFSISFTNEEFQNKDFMNIKGLTEIIKVKKSAQ